MGDADYPICVTCGVQADRPPPDVCPICADDRQFVPPTGQSWTTLTQMRRDGYRNDVVAQEPDLYGIGTRPPFAIGQRALLVRSRDANVLWDCISYLDDATVAAVTELGGIDAIAVSHPHFYGSMADWSHAFGDAPVYIAAADREWVQRPFSAIEWYDGEVRIGEQVTIRRCGGHFPGSAVLHWADGAEGRGVLAVGDTMPVAKDRRHVSFMHSYVNFVPLGPEEVHGVVAAIGDLAFDRIYGVGWSLVVVEGGRRVMLESRDRYLRAIGQPPV